MLPSVDFAPLMRLLLLAAVGAAVPLAWVWLRRQGERPQPRLALLAGVTLFLTFDLIVFGAFTRLTDSGLGCPDWPGCYGHASPIGAGAPIAAAEAALPSGPVTQTKAWIEMLHRYFAMVVGALCLVMAGAGWAARRSLPHSPWWPTVTAVWVLVQGLFGKFTVTLKLYPAVVTLHLLGAMVLLMLLAVQRESFLGRPLPAAPGLRRAVAAVLGLVLLQVALGGWVSTNYAVLACSGFPQCNGQWWPSAAWTQGFAVLRELGHGPDGALLPFDALVAIHLAHRAAALVVVAAVLALAVALLRSGAAALRRWAWLLAGLVAAQVASGLSNVVLQWPIVGALAHSAGAAALVLVLTLLLARVRAAQALPRRAAARMGLA